MERKVVKFLKHWQEDENRKPLVVYGSKQVGKTYTVLKFGEENYTNVVYIDADNNKVLKEGLKKQNTIDGIIAKLSEITKEEIKKNETLVVIDNLNDVDIVNTIKTIGKFKNEYHVILITSLRDNLNKFKGTELQFKSMLPMDFEEYLVAVGKGELVDFIKNSFKNSTKMPFHKVAMEYYNSYILTGGMPEAVELSLRDNNKILQNSVFDKIIDTYKKEISLQDNLIDISRSIEVYDSISSQLMKSNKKFQYGLIKDGGRSKEYENSLTFLHNNGLIYKCYRLDEIKSPISNYKDKDSFKVYMNDTGLLYKKLKINEAIFNSDDKVKQVLYENSVAISLISAGYSIYYYQSDGKAFVDFVIQTRGGNIVPIELVPFNKTKSKALAVYVNKYKPSEAIRITQDNFCMKKGVRYIPLYATFCLSELV
ncbi:MAG: ATP-binding protein [Bacilli bacterium]|nr:ATP-binding protein [Bacilli bacterium]